MFALQPSFLDDAPDQALHHLLQVVLGREMVRRSRLSHVNAVEHVVDLLKRSKNIIVLTGAGVSPTRLFYTSILTQIDINLPGNPRLQIKRQWAIFPT
jgi:hypothetical protein